MFVDATDQFQEDFVEEENNKKFDVEASFSQSQEEEEGILDVNNESDDVITGDFSLSQEQGLFKSTCVRLCRVSASFELYSSRYYTHHN